MRPQIKKRISRLLAVILVGAAFLPVYGLPKEERPLIEEYPEKHLLLCVAGQEDVALGGMEKDSDEKAYPASITKLLTAMVALERAEETAVVVVKKAATELSSANSKIGIRETEQYTLLDLLYGLLLPSGCDAAKAIAMHISADEAAFAELMNEKARELGMYESHFTNASGLHDEDQYSTARDLAKLGAAVAKNERICEILQAKAYEIEEITTGRIISVRNINRLVNDPAPGDYEKLTALYPYCIGGKTGSTNAAGRTFIAMARYRGVTLVCVLLEDKVSTRGLSGSKKDAVVARRFAEARELFAYGFATLFPDCPIENWLQGDIRRDFVYEIQGVSLLISAVPPEEAIELSAAVAEQRDSIQAEARFFDAALPLKTGELLGQADYYLDDTLLFSLPLYCPCDVELPRETERAYSIGVSEEAMELTPQKNAVQQKERGFRLIYLLPLLALLLSVAFILYCRKQTGRKQ